MTHELHVPKRRTPVELTLVDGRVLKVEVFLSNFAEQHSGPERIADLLNGPQEFLPAIEAGAEPAANFFVRRVNIVAARFSRDSEVLEAEADLQNIATEHEVELQLIGGLKLQGLITYELPPHASRLIDFLNVAPEFFPVVEERSITLVNKSHITSALLLQR